MQQRQLDIALQLGDASLLGAAAPRPRLHLTHAMSLELFSLLRQVTRIYSIHCAHSLEYSSETYGAMEFCKGQPLVLLVKSADEFVERASAVHGESTELDPRLKVTIQLAQLLTASQRLALLHERGAHLQRAIEASLHGQLGLQLGSLQLGPLQPFEHDALRQFVEAHLSDLSLSIVERGLHLVLDNAPIGESAEAPRKETLAVVLSEV